MSSFELTGSKSVNKRRDRSMNNLMWRDKKTLSLAAIILCVALYGNAALPPPEKLLPDDTLAMVTAPNFSKIRDISKASPQSRLWNDPAMRPFKEKFLSKWKDDFVKPLERELAIHFDDYLSLPQGQVTLAITLNGAGEKEDQSPGVLFLVDTGEKSPQKQHAGRLILFFAGAVQSDCQGHQPL